MKRTLALLAALGLLASTAVPLGPSYANGDEDGAASSTAPEATTDTADQETDDDEALKVLEGGFSIPAADGDDAAKDGADKK